jgi:NAD(P)-dependent dehydrogenase (short-subunit alcohol dehydrogenase family)
MQGRVALISGANRGIGLEIARQLAAQGLTVVVGGREEAAARAAAAGIDGDARPRQLDITDQASVDRCVAGIDEELGRLDVLVNNAGIGSFGIAGSDADVEAARPTIEVNLFGSWRLSVACIPLMRRTGGGRIVNVSSGMGQLSDMGGGSAPYRLSKAALNALTRILAAELATDGILVNSACPGWVRTDMGTSAAPRSVQEGADTPVWLATLPDDGPTGGFFRNREPIPW